MPPVVGKQDRDHRLERAARRTVESTQGTELLLGVQEFFALLGIVAGFVVLFTIPGWYGIRAWRRYRRGEPSSIRGYSYFGVVAAFVVVAAVVGSLALKDSRSTSPDCVDPVAVRLSNQQSNRAISSAEEAIVMQRFPAATAFLREAAAAQRATAQAVAADPAIAEPLLRAANLLDAAADSADAGRGDVASVQLTRYNAQLKQAVDAIANSVLPVC